MSATLVCGIGGALPVWGEGSRGGDGGGGDGSRYVPVPSAGAQETVTCQPLRCPPMKGLMTDDPLKNALAALPRIATEDRLPEGLLPEGFGAKYEIKSFRNAAILLSTAHGG